MKAPDDLPGASDGIAWFGYFPVFHDGGILDIDLRPRAVSSLRLMPSRSPMTSTRRDF